eukprot:411094_1
MVMWDIFNGKKMNGKPPIGIHNITGIAKMRVFCSSLNMVCRVDKRCPCEEKCRTVPWLTGWIKDNELMKKRTLFSENMWRKSVKERQQDKGTYKRKYFKKTKQLYVDIFVELYVENDWANMDLPKYKDIAVMMNNKLQSLNIKYDKQNASKITNLVNRLCNFHGYIKTPGTRHYNIKLIKNNNS